MKRFNDFKINEGRLFEEYDSSWENEDDHIKEIKDFALFIIKGSSSLATKDKIFKMISKGEGIELVNDLYEDFKRLGPVK